MIWVTSSYRCMLKQTQQLSLQSSHSTEKNTAAWSDQLVVRQSSVREVEGWSLGSDQLSGS